MSCLISSMHITFKSTANIDDGDAERQKKSFARINAKIVSRFLHCRVRIGLWRWADSEFTTSITLNVSLGERNVASPLILHYQRIHAWHVVCDRRQSMWNCKKKCRPKKRCGNVLCAIFTIAKYATTLLNIIRHFECDVICNQRHLMPLRLEYRVLRFAPQRKCDMCARAFRLSSRISIS